MRSGFDYLTFWCIQIFSSLLLTCCIHIPLTQKHMYWERLRSIVMSSLCVCLSVCLFVREDISRTTCKIFTNFLCMLPMAEARSCSGRVTKSQGKVQFLGFPIDHALYRIAFGTYTKMAKPIDMPFSPHAPLSSTLEARSSSVRVTKSLVEIVLWLYIKLTYFYLLTYPVSISVVTQWASIPGMTVTLLFHSHLCQLFWQPWCRARK